MWYILLLDYTLLFVLDQLYKFMYMKSTFIAHVLQHQMSEANCDFFYL